MKILAVIDMQNDFIDGSLGTAEAVAIVDNVAKKIEEFRTPDCEIVFTRDTHYEDYLSTMEGKKLPVEHCIKGTHGWEISEKLDTSGCTIINKPTFGSYELAEFIAANPRIDEVVIVGLCTDICVISNALLIRSMNPTLDISVLSNLCKGSDEDSHRAALQVMKNCLIEVKEV